LLLYAYAGAVRLYRRSRRYYGDHGATFWNMALCHAALGDPAEAASCLAEAKRLDANFAPTTALPVKAAKA
jgi:Tfp pilus assembly protein PilF